MSVQDYYAELQKGIIRASVHEETEDKICHFYFGLHTEIQDILDYKEYNIVNHLCQLAMLAEKELQGHQPMKMKTSFTPCSTAMAPSRTATPLGAHSSMINSASQPPSTSLTPSTILPRTTDLSKASVLQGVGAAKPSSSTVPTGAHRTLGVTVAMVLATSSTTAPARSPTLLQLMTVI
jgi:hypothetical protein